MQHSLDRRLNFGCGAMVGGALGLLGALNSGDYSPGVTVVIAATAAFGAGLLALRFGKKFFDKLSDWLSWLTW